MRVSKIETLKKELLKSNNCRQQIVEMLAEVAVDTMQVFDFGARKHPDSGEMPNFLMSDGNKCDLKTRGKCTLGHVGAAHLNPGAVESGENESGLSHLLHAIADCAILYIRHKRNIQHPLDVENGQHSNDEV